MSLYGKPPGVLLAQKAKMRSKHPFRGLFVVGGTHIATKAVWRRGRISTLSAARGTGSMVALGGLNLVFGVIF